MLTAAQKTQFGTKSPLEGLGLALNKKRGTLKCVYDFAVLGGAVSTINLVDDDGNPAVLPSKAIITQVYSDVVTAPTSGGSATMSLGANTTVDLLAATAVASWTGTQAGIPVGTAATMVKLTAQRNIVMAIAVAALTAGKINVFVDFVLSE